MPHIQTDTINIYMEEKGEGSAVLHINGTGADLRQRPNVLDGPLTEQRHVITYDQRGLGQTEKPEGPYTMAQYADDAASLLDALGHEQVDVVGVSYGGMVAQHLAIRHPDRIARLVLCCTSPGGDCQSYPFHELPADITAVDRLMTLMSVSDNRRDKAWQEANPEMVNHFKELTISSRIPDHDTPEFRRGAQLQLGARRDHDTNEQLPALSMPTLICAGRYDGIASEQAQLRLQSLIPQSALQWYEGGHLFLLQDKQAWKDIIEFLG